MRGWLVLVWLASACGPVTSPYGSAEPDSAADGEPAGLGRLDYRTIEFAFDGGQIELELYRRGSRVTQVARNRYAVPMVIRWTMHSFDNLEPISPVEGVVTLPAADGPLGNGSTVVLAELDQLDTTRRYHRALHLRARFGDPRATPTDYVYALPFPHGLAYAVIQGFHGEFSHRGSNEYAVDFDCPVATSVLAARPGVVVAANGAAQGSGTSEEFLDFRRTNFVLIRHDDDTLGEYMHLATSGIQVKPGQQVERGQPLALSGNTGFSSTPHLHFQVMTAGSDGLTARSFPFVFAVSGRRAEPPIEGRRYTAWEGPPRRGRRE